MKGIIITGHGHFASGMRSALFTVAGEQNHCMAVDFLAEESEDKFKTDLKRAFNALADCEHILVLTDILGGTPFKTAVEFLDSVNPGVQIVTGTNLGMLLEAAMEQKVDCSHNMADGIIQTGKEHILNFSVMDMMTSFEEDL